MAVLSARARREVPKGEFGVPSKAPGSGSYPMPDKNHARAALSMAHYAPASEQPAIKAKAHRILGEAGGGTMGYSGGGRMSVAQDMVSDRRRGIKEDSAEDRRLDRARGISEASERPYYRGRGKALPGLDR